MRISLFFYNNEKRGLIKIIMKNYIKVILMQYFNISAMKPSILSITKILIIQCVQKYFIMFIYLVILQSF